MPLPNLKKITSRTCQQFFIKIIFFFVMSCPFFSCFLPEWLILGCDNHDITVACASKVYFKESAQK